MSVMNWRFRVVVVISHLNLGFSLTLLYSFTQQTASFCAFFAQIGPDYDARSRIGRDCFLASCLGFE